MMQLVYSCVCGKLVEDPNQQVSVKQAEAWEQSYLYHNGKRFPAATLTRVLDVVENHLYVCADCQSATTA